MTFFLPRTPAPTGLPPKVIAVPSYGETVAAGWRADRLERNVFDQRAQYRAEVVGEIEARVGGPAPAPQAPADVGVDPVTRRQMTADRRAAEALRRASMLAAQEPGRVGDIPLDEAQLEAEVLRRMRADWEDAQTILAASPSGRTGAATLGMLASGVADPVTIAAAPFGAGPRLGIAAAAGLEAGINMVAEAVNLPAQFEMAEILGAPDPDAMFQIGVAGVIGGGVGAAVQGAPAAARYFGYRRARGEAAAATAVDGRTPAAHATEIERQAEILANDRAAAAAAATPSRTPDDDVAARIVGVESGGRANAKNPASSASGLGQFTDGTWLATVRRHRPDLAGRSDAQLLALKNDEKLGWEMTVAHTADNRAGLRAAGLPDTDGNLYLAHFLGLGGARRALSVSPDAPIAAAMTPAQIAANANIKLNGKPLPQWSVAELRLWADRKMGVAGRYAGPASAPGDDVPIFETTAGYTRTGQVTTGSDRRIDVEYEVVDAARLIPASGDLQPRDRSALRSDAWIAARAPRLDPAQLMPSPWADRGAPIVGPDDVIESGNGRFALIAAAYERFPDRAAAYRAAIEARTGAPIPEGIERPVLIARRTSAMDEAERVAFAREAQDSGVARMTPVEIARAMRGALTPEALDRADLGRPLTDPANRAFVRDMIDQLPPSERGALIDEAGDGLTADGRRTLARALTARAWPAPDILNRAILTEEAGPLRALLDALEEAAPQWSALAADIEAGRVRPEFDITPEVLDAVRLIADARRIAAEFGGPVETAIGELLERVDLLEGAISPLTAALVRKLHPGGKALAKDKAAEFLRRYAAEARAAGRTGDLMAASGPAEILRRLDPETFGELPDDFARAPANFTRSDQPRRPAVPQMREGAFAEGASSPDAVEADLAAVEELSGDGGPFGPVFDGYRDDPEAAIARLMQERRGEVADAVIREDLGPVALVYGTPAYGLRHIEMKRPGMIAKLPALLRDGRLVADPGGLPRAFIASAADPADVAVLRLDWDGEQKTWLVTTFTDDQGSVVARQPRTSNEPAASASSRIPDATGPSENTPSAAADQDDIASALAAAREAGDAEELLLPDADGVLRPAREILEDIEGDVELSEVLALCGVGGAA